MKNTKQKTTSAQAEENTKTTKTKNQNIAELVADLQRLRADFENYRKRVDDEKITIKQCGAESMIEKFLPVLDTIDRALSGFPEELADNAWAQGIQSLSKKLTKVESEIGLEKIIATPGTPFNHNFHHAVAIDDSQGDKEIVVEELQSGYTLNGNIVREAAVRVGRE